MNCETKPLPGVVRTGANLGANPGGSCSNDLTTKSSIEQADYASQARKWRSGAIKRDSIWRLSRIAQEHLDRLIWSVEQDDDGAVRANCRTVVSHIKAVVALVNDLGAPND